MQLPKVYKSQSSDKYLVFHDNQEAFCSKFSVPFVYMYYAVKINLRDVLLVVLVLDLAKRLLKG